MGFLIATPMNRPAREGDKMTTEWPAPKGGEKQAAFDAAMRKHGVEMIDTTAY